MIKVKPWAMTGARNPKFLIGERIYFIPYIIRRAYVIATTALSIQYWFVNNYIDWDQFNILYDKDFEIKETRVIDKVAV